MTDNVSDKQKVNDSHTSENKVNSEPTENKATTSNSPENNSVTDNVTDKQNNQNKQESWVAQTACSIYAELETLGKWLVTPGNDTASKHLPEPPDITSKSSQDNTNKDNKDSPKDPANKADTELCKNSSVYQTNLFDKNAWRNPFDNGSNTNPFLNGSHTTFVQAKDNTVSAGLFGVTSQDLSSKLSSFFYSKDIAPISSSTKPAEESKAASSSTLATQENAKNNTPDANNQDSLVDTAFNGIRQVGNALFEGSNDLLTSIFGSSNDNKPAETSESRSTHQLDVSLENKQGPKIEKLADGTVKYAGITPDGQHLEVNKSNTEINAKTEQAQIHKDCKTGNVTVTTTDGRHFEQAKNERTASNDHFNLQVKQEGEKVIFTDKSGHPVMEFNSRGDAQRFLNNCVIDLVHPGETLEAAAKRLQGENKLNGKAQVIMDGQGNVLSIDENGNKMHRYADGRIDLVYKKHEQNGHESTIRICAKQLDKNHSLIKIYVHGQYVEISSLKEAEINKLIAGSDLKWHHGCLARQHAHRGSQTNPTQDYSPVISTNGQVQITQGVILDQSTGAVTAKNGNHEVIASSNPASNTATITESVNGEVNRTTTMNAHGKIAIQGNNPEDTITYEPSKGEVNAWGIIMSPSRSQIVNSDGSKTIVDSKGNFEMFSRDGQSILSSQNNTLKFFDDTEITAGNEIHSPYYNNSTEQQAREKELAQQQALTTANEVAAFAIQIAHATAGVVSPDAVASMMGQINDCLSRLAIVNIPVPGQLLAAQEQLKNIEHKFDYQVKVQGLLHAKTGIVNDTLVNYALQNGLVDPDMAANYAVNKWNHST